MKKEKKKKKEAGSNTHTQKHTKRGKREITEELGRHVIWGEGLFYTQDSPQTVYRIGVHYYR